MLIRQNRLTWASSYSRTGPCGLVNNGGSLTAQGAKYTASYPYDALNRLTSSPLGTYTYGDPAHLHAATTVSNGSTIAFTGAYDVAGDRTCQTSCFREPTRQEIDLSYDTERRLTTWYDPAASTTVNFAYDGEGNRVAQQTNVSGTTSTTDYLAGGLEEVTTSGSNTTLTKYESVPGVCSVVIVGSGPSESISYVATDGLGSVSEALDGSGNVTAQQLFGPYGTGRYSSGAMPTAKGYTGQYADAATGLDYYHARYYDPAIGQFASADSVDAGGLNRYAYVSDNPETQSDPSGHCFPLCLVAAAVGAAVGLGVGVAAATSDGQGWSLGNVAHVAADVALGATAGAALTSKWQSWRRVGGRDGRRGRDCGHRDRNGTLVRRNCPVRV